LADFNRALLRDPNNVFGLCERGYVYYSLEMYDYALNDIDKALVIDPNNSFAQNLKSKVESAKSVMV
jgi:tetratricopeptide (TPR) repeat protein